MIRLITAVIPVIFLCWYIYKKDIHKEPKKLLISIFFKGIIACAPIILFEVLVGGIFDTDDRTLPFLQIFINVFFGVGVIEELFKWIVAYRSGYKSREFDEVYDIIVYAVFASLGFACIENIFYVLENGMYVGIMRAILSVPGHACFGILMGYYLSKAKINDMNGSKVLAKKNLIFSLLIPSLFHTAYDAFLSTDDGIYFIAFIAFDIFMVAYCFGIVKKMSKIQNNVSLSLESGKITEGKDGTINYQSTPTMGAMNFCPICGHKVEGANFCPSCGFKLK